MRMRADTRVHTYKHVHMHIAHTERMKERKHKKREEEAGRKGKRGGGREEGENKKAKGDENLGLPYADPWSTLRNREDGLLLLLF